MPSLLFSGLGPRQSPDTISRDFHYGLPNPPQYADSKFIRDPQFRALGHHRSLWLRFTGNLRRQSELIEFILIELVRKHGMKAGTGSRRSRGFILAAPVDIKFKRSQRNILPRRSQSYGHTDRSAAGGYPAREETLPLIDGLSVWAGFRHGGEFRIRRFIFRGLPERLFRV
jgi:hypothetical protein